MFVRKENNLPGEADFPTTLAEMGYKVNEKGQIVQVSSGKFHPFYPSNSERYNQREREAMHVLARGVVKGRLAEHGVEEMFVYGNAGEKVKNGLRPVQPHIRIFATKRDHLILKKDVILIIGEHTEDPGVWAYRHLMNEGGIDGGSAVGLMKKLEERGMEVFEEDEGGSAPQGGRDPYKPMTTHEAVGLSPAAQTLKRSEEDPMCLVETADGFHTADLNVHERREVEAGAAETAAKRNDSIVSVSTNQVPGVIIFNPGQRLYSHVLNECMTWATWSARPKYNGIGDSYKINNLRNHVPGHFTTTEHVETMFEDIIPQLVRDDVRFWVVGIADGAENFINYMDAKLTKEPKAKIGLQVNGMAFMEPTHLPDKLQSFPFKLSLSTFAKSWIKSSKPLGTWRNKDGSLNPIMSESQLSLPADKAKVRKAMESFWKKSIGVEENKPPGQSSMAGPSGTNTKPVVASRSGNEVINDPISTWFGPEDPLALPDHIREESYKLPKSAVPDLLAQGFPVKALEYNKPPSYTTTSPEDEGDPSTAEKRKSDSSSHSLSPRGSPKFSAMSSGSEVSRPREGGSPPAPLPKPVLSLTSDTGSSPEHRSASSKSPDDQPLSAVTEENAEDDDDPMAESIDYENTPVSCHTYSGGTLITEMIWPNAMEDVLEWFKWMAEGRPSST